MRTFLKNPVSRIVCWYLAITLATVFPFMMGCATKGTLNAKSILSENAPRKVKREMSLAFGRMQVTVSGEPWKGQMYIILAQSEEKFSGWLKVRHVGDFFLKLAPGSYRIASMKVGYLEAEKFIEPTPFEFNIPEAGKIYYLGDMKIDLTGERHFLKATILNGIEDVSTVDNYNEAKNLLISMHAEWKGKVEKHLIKLDEAVEKEDMQLIERSNSKYGQMNTAQDDYNTGKYDGILLLVYIGAIIYSLAHMFDNFLPTPLFTF